MTDKIKEFESAKDMRMFPYEITHALTRKENAFKRIRTLEFEGISLHTEHKRAYYTGRVKPLSTQDLDHLMKIFALHFDDYTLSPVGSWIKIVCEVYYGVE